MSEHLSPPCWKLLNTNQSRFGAVSRNEYSTNMQPPCSKPQRFPTFVTVEVLGIADVARVHTCR